jgi:lysophospholipase L1-like esterase
MPITVFNAGIGGDTAFDMNKRLDNDVFSKNPTALMVTFGMNDSGYFEYNGDHAAEYGEEKYQESIKNFQNMVARFKQLPSTRIVMVGTSPYDEGAKIEGNNFHGKNATIKRIVAYQMEEAEKNGWEHIDWNEPMMELNRKGQATDSTFTLCGSDRIHPDNDGHMVMAYMFLKAQGMAGKPVADFSVNSKNLKIEKSENCEISNVKRNGKDLQFDYLAKSLPYPMDTIAHGWGFHRPQALAKDIIPFMDEMNSEKLTVTGLSGDYKLLIDDEEIGVWSGKELAAGINLAESSKTPEYQQALAVMTLNERRWEIERMFRDYAWVQHGFFQQEGLLNANNRKAIEVMDANVDKNLWLRAKRELYAGMMYEPVREAMNNEMKLLVDQIYSINKPVSHRIVLRKL